MVKVAITGGAATGKSSVCKYFKELEGVCVLDLDVLAREAVRPTSSVFRSVVERFGKDVVAPDGSLDRRKLRGIITKDSRAKTVLEGLIHPEIFRLFEEELAAIQRRRDVEVVVAEVPLLVEVGLQNRFDVVVLVEADPGLQKRRLMVRDGSSAAEAEALLDIQMAPEKKRAYANYVIENHGTLKDVQSAVEKLYRKIIKGF